MKLKLLNLSKTEIRTIALPEQFYEPVRLDLIKRAVLAIQSNNRQPYGANPEAGKRASAELSRRRHKYRGSYGFGISRVPRKILSRRGTRMNWVGAFAPGTVGGRRAHPPKAEKIWKQKINIKERRKAIRSAIAASINIELIKERGHEVPKNFPFIVDDKIEELSTTKELKKVLNKLGFKEELERINEKKILSGKAKFRGRKYSIKKGPLIVISKKGLIEKATSNIPGIETVLVQNLNAEILAPGTHPGRLTIYTESSVKELSEKKLFTKNFRGEKQINEQKFKEGKAEKILEKEKKKVTKTKKTVKKTRKTGTKTKKKTTKKETKKKK